MINIDKFEEKLYSYQCGNIRDTKKWLKSLSREDRATVIDWLHGLDVETAHKWAIWIISGSL